MKILATSCLLAVALATSSYAGAPSAKDPVIAPTPPACPPTPAYSYVLADWQHTWFDGDLADNDGVGLELSYEFIEQVYARGTIAWSDAFDWSYTAGLGGYIPLSENIHLVGEAGGLFSDSENGWYVYPHLRGKFGCLELHAGAKYLEFEDFGGFWEGHINAFYQVATNTDLAVGGIFSEEASTLSVGVRYRF